MEHVNDEQNEAEGNHVMIDQSFKTLGPHAVNLRTGKPNINPIVRAQARGGRAESVPGIPQLNEHYVQRPD